MILVPTHRTRLHEAPSEDAKGPFGPSSMYGYSIVHILLNKIDLCWVVHTSHGLDPPFPRGWVHLQTES